MVGRLRVRYGRRLTWAGVVALLLIGAIGVWALVGDVPFIRNPFRQLQLPSYLDPAAPDVAAARDHAGNRDELMASLDAHLAVRSVDQQGLWQSLDQYARSPAVDEWQDGRRIALGTADPWPVPANPDWTENPYDNITWLSYYQSLAWLQAPGQLYRDTHDTEYRDEVVSYLLDWIAENPQSHPASVRSWYDHTVAWRTDALVSLFNPVLLDGLNPQQLDTVLGFLWQHGKLLYGYLSNPAFIGHNHNLFHAMSLYNLAVAFPEFRDAAEWKAAAHARVESLLGEMVDAQGVSTEQAAGYAYLALGLFNSAEAYFASHDDPLGSDVEAAIGRMADYAALLEWPDGTLPAYGDTPYGSKANRNLLKEIDARGTGGPELRYMLTKGAEGTRPADLHVYDQTGYAIMRPSYGDGQPWADDLDVFVDLGVWRRVHGHEDAMNVLAYGAGGPLLIDSGGPYVYSDAARRGFVSAEAHNTVIVDGRGYDEGDLKPVDGRLLGSGDDASISWVDATDPQWGTAEHRRTVVVIKPSLLVVVDRLSPTDGGAHAYDLLWHTPPGTVISPSGDSGSSWSGVATTDAGAGMGVAVAGSSPLTTAIVEGQQDPPLGWVTTGTLKREPAPVLSSTLQGAASWFVTVIAPAHADAPPAVPAVSVEGGGSDLALTITLGARHWVLGVAGAEGVSPTLESGD